MKKLIFIIVLTITLGLVSLSLVGIPAPKTNIIKEIPLENLVGTGN